MVERFIERLPDRRIHNDIRPVNAFFPKGLEVGLDSVMDDIPLKEVEADSSLAVRKMILAALEKGKFKGTGEQDPFCPHAEYRLVHAYNVKSLIYDVPSSMGVTLKFPVHAGESYDPKAEKPGMNEITIAENVHMLVKTFGSENGMVRIGNDYYLTSGVVKDEKTKGLKAYLARKLEFDPSFKKKLDGVLEPVDANAV